MDRRGSLQPARDRSGGLGAVRLPFCNAVMSGALPRFIANDVILPIKTIGGEPGTALKLSFWRSNVDGAPQEGDPAFIAVSLRTSPAKAWRDAAPSGVISMLPFEGAYWRFEQAVSFVQFYLPFRLVGEVCDGLFDRELAYADLNMPAEVLDARLHRTLHAVQETAARSEPTNLLLDSWALILSEALLGRLSSHGERRGRTSFGKIPGRGVARVVDYIEAGLDQDLRLASLAEVSAMSLFHFARCFKDTVGVSPHAYVLSRRIARARAMLGRGEGRLAEVALACGFSSQAHLTTAFHRSLGVTPGGYRRSLRS